MKRQQPRKRRIAKARVLDRMAKFQRSAKRQAHKMAPLLERKKGEKDAFAMAMMRKRLEKDLERFLAHYKPRYPDYENSATSEPTAPARRMWLDSPTAM